MKNGVPLDNRSVVPYNPYFLRKYNAHINVEACMSIHSIKYVFKYVYKGHDCALYTIYPIVARALGLAFRPSASREQRYLAYKTAREH